MRQINPLYVGLLLLFVLFFGLFELSQAKQEFSQKSEELQKTLNMAQKLKALKGVYANKTKMLSSLQRVLRQPSLKTAGIRQKMQKNSLVLESHAMNATQLHSLLTKIFNGHYNITQLSIKRLTEKKASFKAEITW